jgi:hypothetical protein
MKWGDGANNKLFTHNTTLEYKMIKFSIINLHKILSNYFIMHNSD